MAALESQDGPCGVREHCASSDATVTIKLRIADTTYLACWGHSHAATAHLQRPRGREVLSPRVERTGLRFRVVRRRDPKPATVLIKTRAEGQAKVNLMAFLIRRREGSPETDFQESVSTKK